MPYPAATSTRAGLIWRIVIPALLGAGGLFASSHADPGSWQFDLATFFTAAIWLGTWLKWGDRRCFSGAAPRELARGAGIGIALIILFLLGALIVRSIPALAGPVSDLPDNMCHGSVPMTLATLIINGVGEKLFFRDVARRALSDVSSPPLTHLPGCPLDRSHRCHGRFKHFSRISRSGHHSHIYCCAMHKLSSLTLAIATACALTACSNDASSPATSPDTDNVDGTTVAVEETTTEDSDDDTSTEEDSAPSPATTADDDDADDANDEAHDDAEENTTNASQIGGDCGTTPQGYPITAGSATSCEFAAAMFAPASKATYTMTPYDPSNPTVGSLYTAHITAKSPVTGENYDLICRIASDNADLTCQKPGDRSVSGTFKSAAHDWPQRVNTVD